MREMHNLSPDIQIAINVNHRFTGDSVLLSEFAKPTRNTTACDLCSGCGIIPLLWFVGANVSPKRVVGVEIDDEAAELFRHSVEINAIGDTVTVLQADLREIERHLPRQSFTLVTCNPPYFKVGTGKVADSARGIARHDISADITDVLTAADYLLSYGGRLCVTFPPDRLVELFAAMTAVGIEPKRMQAVHSYIDKPPRLVLVEGKKGAQSGLRVLPPMVRK